MTSKIQRLVKVAPLYFGQLFDGTNAKELALKLREVVERYESKPKVAYSKHWIKISSDTQETTLVIKKGMWVLWDDKGIKVVDEEVFAAQFKRINPRAKKAAPRYVKGYAEGYDAMQFTGTNSTDVAEFIRSNGGSARAGGSYVRFEPRGEDKINIQKGQTIGFKLSDKNCWFIASDSEIADRFKTTEQLTKNVK